MAENVNGSFGPRRLTARQTAIVRILIQAAPQFVTVGAVAEKLKLSSRTILRELPAIEDWMKENDFSFVRKPSVGIAVQETSEIVHFMEELLSDAHVPGSYDRRERRKWILRDLLCAGEPIKSYVFLSKFHISEGTLSGDLDALGEWFAVYHMEIIRRPGVGIFLQGSETDYRQAIANAVFEFVDEGRLLNFIRSSGDVQEEKKPELSDRLLQFVDPKIVSFLEEIFEETERELGIRYTDSGLMALIVHLTLSVKRLQEGEQIELDQKELNRLALLPEYPVAREIAGHISRQFEIDVPEAEIGFITMHLSSARVWPQARRERSRLQTINTRQIVMSMVELVENKVGLPFHSCSRMIEELSSHMDSMISRLTMNIHLENTQIDMVRQEYPDIYAAVEEACGIFRELLLIDDISPSEVTFVAMHFAAASEKLLEQQDRVAVAVVCPSGMGASRVLAANLRRSFRSIEVRRIVSAFDIEPEGLRSDGIDLVISTVPLNLDYPVVCVSPVPQAQDMLLITQAVESVGRNRKERQKVRSARGLSPKNALTLSSIASLNRTGEEIFQILDHFVIVRLEGTYNTESLLGQAAGLFADGMLTRQIIGADLARREEIKTTFLADMSIYLLHCRTQAVLHCRFGYLKLMQPIQIDAGLVRGAVLMLAPAVDQPEYVEVISRMSMLLVEEERFLEALDRGDENEGKSLVEKMLVKYFENEIKKRIGDEKL